jgi:hypothetical protein
MSVRVESSRDRVNWTKVATTKSDSQGRVRYTVRPRSRHMYRFVFIGGSKWQGFTGTNKLVQTKFTLTGTKPGDFTSKSLWMSTGLRDMRITVAGAHQSVYIHNQTHSQSLLLVNTPGTFSGALQIISAGYGHFRVTGSGRFTIEVWN